MTHWEAPALYFWHHWYGLILTISKLSDIYKKGKNILLLLLFQINGWHFYLCCFLSGSTVCVGLILTALWPHRKTQSCRTSETKKPNISQPDMKLIWRDLFFHQLQLTSCFWLFFFKKPMEIKGYRQQSKNNKKTKNVNIRLSAIYTVQMKCLRYRYFTSSHNEKKTFVVVHCSRHSKMTARY